MITQGAKKNPGTIRCRKNGIYECMIMLSRDADGKRKYKSFYGKSPEEVEAKRDAYYEQMDRPSLCARSYTLEEWLWKWYDHHLPELKPATRESYRYTVKLICAGSLGRLDISTILAYDIECCLRQLKEDGYSSSMISKVRGLLHQALRSAEANNLIQKNPVPLIEKMRRDPPRKKEAFTAHEMKLLMRNLPQTLVGWGGRILLATGMRKQELLALEPRHVAEDGSTIRVEQALTRIKGTAVLSSPKSFDSYRTIPVPQSMRCYAILLRKSGGTTFVFESPKNPGKPINPSYFDDLFRKALEGIEGVRVLTPHCCRHSYVSHMQALGVNLETIKGLVGHADIDMTEQYLHLQEQQIQAAIEKYSAAFCPDWDENN
jgi:integrase